MSTNVKKREKRLFFYILFFGADGAEKGLTKYYFNGKVIQMKRSKMR